MLSGAIWGDFLYHFEHVLANAFVTIMAFILMILRIKEGLHIL